MNLRTFRIKSICLKKIDCLFSSLAVGEYILVRNIKKSLCEKRAFTDAEVINESGTRRLTLTMPELTDAERETVLCGCLVNYYNSGDEK